MAKIATEIMPGKKLGDFNLKKYKIKHFGVKESVFPFWWSGLPLLSPEGGSGNPAKPGYISGF